MYYEFAIELPSSVKKRLAGLCYGLEKVEWIEENSLHLTLRQLGKLSPIQLLEIKEQLKPLFFLPFKLSLSTIHFDQPRGNKGAIWIGVNQLEVLKPLMKEINSLLKGVAFISPSLEAPRINLGHGEKIHPLKLGDYLINHAGFELEPFEITECSLLCLKKTPKVIYYESITSYKAEPMAYDD